MTGILKSWQISTQNWLMTDNPQTTNRFQRSGQRKNAPMSFSHLHIQFAKILQSDTISPLRGKIALVTDDLLYGLPVIGTHPETVLSSSHLKTSKSSFRTLVGDKPHSYSHRMASQLSAHFRSSLDARRAIRAQYNCAFSTRLVCRWVSAVVPIFHQTS